MRQFKQKLDLLGTICGVLGAASSILAVVLRVSLGNSNVNPAGVIVAPRNVLLAGIALMVFGCWLKLTAKDR
jgi:hypothetical protein